MSETPITTTSSFMSAGLTFATFATFATFVVAITPPMNFQRLLKRTSGYFRVFLSTNRRLFHLCCNFRVGDRAPYPADAACRASDQNGICHVLSLYAFNRG